jgi:uncharacterized protein (DUF362 family)
MDRRQFLKGTAVLGAGVVVSPALFGTALAGDGPVVGMAKGAVAAKITRAAVEALGGMATFVTKGQTVVVKPNIGWDRTPEQAANTNPEVVREIVRMCLEAGAAKVLIFDRTCNDPRRCYVSSGIAAAIEGLGDPRVIISHLDERRFRTVELPEALLLKRSSYYEEVLDADRFINVPIAKHHSASGLTIGMKNIMGVIGGNRATLHRNLPEALVDMNRVVRSHLTVVDATRVLVANGPQGGRLEDVRAFDTVIASSDVVAADTIAASLFGKTPKELRYLQLAHDSGLGVADLARIQMKSSGG